MIYKKKIIIYFPSIEKGGVERNFYNLLQDKNFIENFDYKIITFNKHNALEKYNTKTISVFNTFNTNVRIFKLIFTFFLLINHANKNTVILSYQSSLLAVIAAKIKKSKIIVRLNTSPKKYINNYLKKNLFGFFYKNANYVLCNSHAFKKELNELFNIKTVYVNNCIDLDNIKKFANKKFSNKFFLNFKGIKILSVGRLVTQKNYFLALETIKKISKQFNVRYLILGSGKLKNEINYYIKKNNLMNIVKQIDYKKNPYPYIKNSDIILLTSQYEGLPNILLESILLKKFFISSNCPTGPQEVKKIFPLQGMLFKNLSTSSLNRLLIKVFTKKLYLRTKLYENKLRKYFGTNKKLIEILQQT